MVDSALQTFNFINFQLKSGCRKAFNRVGKIKNGNDEEFFLFNINNNCYSIDNVIMYDNKNECGGI